MQKPIRYCPDCGRKVDYDNKCICCSEGRSKCDRKRRVLREVVS